MVVFPRLSTAGGKKYASKIPAEFYRPLPAPAGLKAKKDLAQWVEMGKEHAASLPQKKKK